VLLVLAPGADAGDKDAVRQLIGDAGGTVAGELTLTDAVLDPARSDQLRDLTTRLLPAGAQLPSATDAGGLLGGLLGAVLLSRSQNGQAQVAPDQAQAALAGLAAAGFVRPGPRPGQAPLALILGGGALTGADAPERAATLARLATELRHGGGGAVLAGRSGAAGATGAVGVVRADSAASAGLATVDDVETAVGRVATVLALREQADGRAGRYGEAASAQAVIPGASAG
jgi:Copper transport outer membrane protein, MctB